MEKLMDGKPRELKLGESFKKDGSMAFHSIRYDFQPASVDVTKMAAVEIQESNSVTVTVPHVEGSGTLNTVYKGNKRPVQKECVLIFDHNTGQLSLEKLSNTIQLKKTSEVACEIVGGMMAVKDSNNNVNMDENPSDNKSNDKPSDKFGDKQGQTFGEKLASSDHFKGSRLVQFARKILPDIENYLEKHQLPQELRPIIKLSYGPEQMKEDHPDLYQKMKLRTKVKADELDALMNYLIQVFPKYLSGTANLYKKIERLEDVCDFVLEKVMEVRKKHKK